MASCDKFFTCFFFFFSMTQDIYHVQQIFVEMIFGVFRGFSKDPWHEMEINKWINK